jgi:hypothetical protein
LYLLQATNSNASDLIPESAAHDFQNRQCLDTRAGLNPEGTSNNQGDTDFERGNDTDHDHVDLETLLDNQFYSDKESDSELEINQCEEISEELRKWAVEHQVPNVTISDLIKILRKYHPSLP